MLRRLFTLLCVAALSGMAGTALGILIAPAPGRETREWMAGLIEQHRHIVSEAADYSRQLATVVTEFLTTHVG